MHRVRPLSRAVMLVLVPPGAVVVLEEVFRPNQADVASVVLRLVIFGLLTAALLPQSSGNPESGDESMKQALGASIGAIALGVTVGAFVPAVGLTLPEMATLVLGAAVEELVFRVALPLAVAKALMCGGLGRTAFPLAVIAAQLSFAAAHIVVNAGDISLHAVVDVTRFFALGCLIFVVYQVEGLLAAILFHASLNLAVVVAGFGIALRPTASTTLSWAAVALSIVVLASGRNGPSERPFAPVRIRPQTRW